MPYPRDQLNPGEEVILDLHPHWIYFAEPSITIVVLLIVTLLVASRFDITILNELFAVGILAAAVWTLVRYFKWVRIHFVVTTDRVIYRQGVISRRGVEIPLERIMNVNFSQRMIERAVGAGDLVIESGGRDGQSRFTDVRKPEVVQNIIHRAADDNREHGSGNSRAERAENAKAQFPPPDPPAPPASPTDDVATQLERLAELKDKGVLTQAEFDEQKRKLLGRL